MKTLGVVRKTLRETMRDRLVVLLTLIFAPTFVVMYYFAFTDSTVRYPLGIVNLDTGAIQPDGKSLYAGNDIVKKIRDQAKSKNYPIDNVLTLSDEVTGMEKLRDGKIDALVILSGDTSETTIRLMDRKVTGDRIPIRFIGDQKSSTYMVTAITASVAIEEYISAATGRVGPILIDEIPLAGSVERNDFDIAVSGLFVFAVIMLVFLASMMIAREVEAGSMRRLRLSHMRAIDYLIGVSAVILIIAIVAVSLTFAAAEICGFHRQGSLILAMAVTIFTAFSVIGVGLLVGALSRSVAQAFVIANFPLALMMFFSGSMFPMPSGHVVTILGHGIGPYELMAPTHAVAALNKIFIRDAGLTDVWFELTGLVVTSGIYFILGAVVLNRRHLRSTS